MRKYYPECPCTAYQARTPSQSPCSTGGRRWKTTKSMGGLRGRQGLSGSYLYVDRDIPSTHSRSVIDFIDHSDHRICLLSAAIETNRHTTCRHQHCRQAPANMFSISAAPVLHVTRNAPTNEPRSCSLGPESLLRPLAMICLSSCDERQLLVTFCAFGCNPLRLRKRGERAASVIEVETDLLTRAPFLTRDMCAASIPRRSIRRTQVF